jgi:hypothetical protein
MSVPAEITGKEPPADGGSALDSLIEFYRAFKACDMNARCQLGGRGGSSMDNPLNGFAYPSLMAGHPPRIPPIVTNHPDVRIRISSRTAGVSHKPCSRPTKR